MTELSAGSAVYSLYDLEPNIAAVVDRKTRKLGSGPYVLKSESQILPLLEHFLAANGVEDKVANLARLGGGGSKEQFTFDLIDPKGRPIKYVLRIDPAMSAVETDRRREFELMRALKGTVPVPDARWIDPDGDVFGSPAIIMSFENGATKPPGKPTGKVTGMGIVFEGDLRKALANQYIDHLVAIHGLDWRKAHLPSFQAPVADVYQAARWQLNWWARIWHDDAVQAIPTFAVIEQWLRSNLPACEYPVIVHADYRSGNFLFDPDTGQITSILDWEISHIGDYHRDLAYAFLSVLSTQENGMTYSLGLFERQWFLREYAARSGRKIDPAALHFYHVLNAYMSAVLTLGTNVRVAKEGLSHQDTHAAWLAAAGHVLHTEMCELIERGRDYDSIN
jgi:aminoglycoside phosphotransferase (APT) family kinase protein